MEPVPEQIIVGIDVSKQAFDVATSTGTGSRTYPATSAGYAALVTLAQSWPCVLIVLEATGEYHLPLVTALDEAGFPVAICNPAHVRAFGRGMGIRSKTDRSDAQVLVAFGQARRPIPRFQPSPQLRHLKALIARRDDLVSMRVMERNRRSATHDPVVAASLEQISALLSDQITALNLAIANLIASEPDLAERKTRLASVPGIGPVIAARCLVDLPDLGAMTKKQIAAYVGVAPYARDSGQFHGKRFIQAGKAVVRQSLYQAVFSAVHTTRRTNLLKTHYQHLRDQGKHPKVALVATMRRLLTYLTVMARDNLDWNQLDVNQGPKTAPAD
jgi:transposase